MQDSRTEDADEDSQRSAFLRSRQAESIRCGEFALRVLLLLCVFLSIARQTSFAENAMNIGSHRELFVDSSLIEKLSHVNLVPLRPEPREVVFVADKPWEGNTSAYFTVLADGGKFRMYYRGSQLDAERTNKNHHEVTCYAESTDGVSWTRPNLGLFDFQGSKENNIVWAGPESGTFTPFLDENPSRRAEAAYRAVAWDESQGLVSFVSPDAIHWKRERREAMLPSGTFDSQNLAFWDAASGRYRLFHRGWRKGRREIQTATSVDFQNWSASRPLELEPQASDQYYTNAIRPYVRAPQILVGFPSRFVDATAQVEPVFISSRDGVRFRRSENVLVPLDAPEERNAARSNYAANALLALPGANAELSLYATEGAYGQGKGTRLRRFVFGVDAFIAARADAEVEGELLSRPFIFSGERLLLTFAARETGEVKVEVTAADGVAVPGLRLDDGTAMNGKAVDAEYQWSAKDSLKKVAGKAVRLRIRLRQADLFSFRFAER